MAMKYAINVTSSTHLALKMSRIIMMWLALIAWRVTRVHCGTTNNVLDLRVLLKFGFVNFATDRFKMV